MGKDSSSAGCASQESLGPQPLSSAEASSPALEKKPSRKVKRSKRGSVALAALLNQDPGISKTLSPGVRPEDPMSEAGRKVLLFHFQRMLSHEAGARAGEDAEELHDMRVATRRMRAAFRVFGPFFRRKAIAPFRKELGKAAGFLGAVRDLDVFMEKARKYLQGLPPEESNSLDPLLASWQDQREKARGRLIAYLDGATYRAFCESFAAFLQTEGAGARGFPRRMPAPCLVAHVAPVAIHERWSEVRAFAPLLADAPTNVLHALRIHCKRLRYTLEFFQEVLGPEAAEVIKEVVAMQDHLGALQDAVVASDILRSFLNEWTERQKTEWAARHVDLHGVANYLAAKQAERNELLAALPAKWERLMAFEFRQKLAAAVAAL